MGSRFSIEAIVSMIDRVSNPMKKASKSVSMFSDTTRKKTSVANRALGGLKSQVGAFVGIGTVALLGKQFLDFDQAVTSASAKFPGLKRNTEAGQKTLEQLRMTARKVGAETEHSAAQAASGLDFLAMAGFNARQSMSLLPGVANLATVADMDFARATDIASDALGAFGLMTNNTEQLGKNFTRIQDVMAATITATNTNMEDLFEATKYGAPVFTAAGQSMETFNAIAGRMASNSYKGSQAGTALRAGMLRLAAPPKDAADAIAAMNLQVADSQGNMRNMIDILADIETKTKGMTEQQRLSTLQSIFGTRAVSAYAAILKEGVHQTKALEKQLMSSNGASAEMAETMRTSLMNQLKGLLSALTELGFSFLDAFSKSGSDGIKTLTKAVRSIIPAVRLFAKFVAALIPYLKYALILYGLWKVALIAIMVTQKGMIALGWLKYIIMMRGAIMKAVTMTKAWAAAQWLLNAALSANPIGLIIIAVAALIGAIYLLYKNWDAVAADFERKGIAIQGIIDGLTVKLYKFLYALGLISKKKLQLAQLEELETAKKFISAQVKLNKIMEGGIKGVPKFLMPYLPESMKGKKGKQETPINQQGNMGFASPMSQQIVTNSTNTTNGNLNINVNGPKEYAEVEQKGKMPIGSKLNLGLQ